MSHLPFKTLLAVVALSFVTVKFPPLSLGYGLGKESIKDAEFYPLSSFPMYSRFSSRPIYVYLTGSDGKPLPSFTRFGILSSELKKIYDRHLRVEKKRTGTGLSKMSLAEKRPAAIATLRQVRDRTVTLPEGGVRLHEVALTFDASGKVVETDLVVGEF